MGVYDTFGELQIQLKVGECVGHHYNIGDNVPNLPDGIFLDYDGAVVIKDGKFVADFKQLHSKWGHSINPSSIVNDLNPVTQAVKKAEKDLKKKNED